MPKFLLLLAILFCLPAWAQQKLSIQPESPSIKVRQVLLQKIQSFTEAWGRSDTVALGKLLTREYRHNDIWGKALHRKDWLAYAALPRKISNMEMSEVEILIYNKNMAVVTGKMNYQLGEEKITQQIRFTQLWTQDHNQWKRASFQATLIDKSK